MEPAQRLSKSNPHSTSQPAAPASAWQASCCRFDRSEVERLVGSHPGPGRDISGGVFVEAEDMLVGTNGRGQWQLWLVEWEERQRALLRVHEETTRDCVGNLKSELLERLERLEKLERPRLRQKFASIRSIDKEDFRRRSNVAEGEKRSLLRVDGPSTEGSARTHFTETARPFAPTFSTQHKKMNDAITSVVGGFKNRRHSVASAGERHSAGIDEREKGPREALEKGMSVLDLDLDDDERPPPGEFRGTIYSMVHHRFFTAFSMALVLAYALAAGIMSDIEMRRSLESAESPTWRWVVDMGFTAFFLFECSLKLIAEGGNFFKGKERAWNIFDLSVAMSGLLDVIAISAVSFSFLRVLRTFRAIRVLRIMRILSFFKDLRLMVASILCCLLSLGSAFTLLIAVMYIFAVILLQSASEFIRESEVTPEVKQVLSEGFGNMLLTTYSLSQAVSGGRSWGEFAAPFVEIHSMYGVLFTLFVAFVVFGVLNILTGVFVESTASLATIDKELVIQEQLSRNQSLVNQIRRLFKEIDQDGSGTLTFQELKNNLNDDRVKAYFSVLQMDVSEAHGLFQLLDQDDTGEVSIEEFIMTCMRLKGTARSIDLATMLAENKKVHQMLKSFMKLVSDNFVDISSRIKALQSSQDELLSDSYY